MNIYIGLVDPGYARRLSFDEGNASMSDLTLVSQNTANQFQSLLIQDMANGERVAFKTGTSFARQDAWSVQIYDKHLVLVWIGTPDNEPTTTLTGASAAFPVSLAIGRSLGLAPPSLPQVKIVQQSSDFQMEEACSGLIQYPENNAWIKSSSQKITITGDLDANWYLNGVKLRAQMKQVQITEPGINTITAVRGDCRETNEFFVDF